MLFHSLTGVYVVCTVCVTGFGSDQQCCSFKPGGGSRSQRKRRALRIAGEEVCMWVGDSFHSHVIFWDFPSVSAGMCWILSSCDCM